MVAGCQPVCYEACVEHLAGSESGCGWAGGLSGSPILSADKFFVDSICF